MVKIVMKMMPMRTAGGGDGSNSEKCDGDGVN